MAPKITCPCSLVLVENWLRASGFGASDGLGGSTACGASIGGGDGIVSGVNGADAAGASIGGLISTGGGDGIGSNVRTGGVVITVVVVVLVRSKLPSGDLIEVLVTVLRIIRRTFCLRCFFLLEAISELGLDSATVGVFDSGVMELDSTAWAPLTSSSANSPLAVIVNQFSFLFKIFTPIRIYGSLYNRSRDIKPSID